MSFRRMFSIVSNVTFVVAILVAMVMMFIALCSPAFPQVTVLGTMTVDTVKYDYWNALKPLLEDKIFDKKQDGSTILFIPLYKVYGNIRASVALYDFEFYPYDYDSKTEKVTLHKITDYAVIEYNLKNHKYQIKKYKNDTFNDFKENNEKKITDKIKEKEKEKENKPKPKDKP